MSPPAEITDLPVGLGAYMERLRPLVDDTIEKLAATTFREDPIGGRKYSRATSIMSSAYKRHGQILESAIVERLRECARLDVWHEDAFKLSPDSLTQLRIHDKIEACLQQALPYGEAEREVPIDMVVFDQASQTLRSYNVKRGNGAYDAGKRRIILGELLRINMLLMDYGRQLDLTLRLAEAKIIFYYGLRSIPEPLSLIGDDLDEHFDFEVVAAVESVNSYFKRKLHALIEEE